MEKCSHNCQISVDESMLVEEDFNESNGEHFAHKSNNVQLCKFVSSPNLIVQPDVYFCGENLTRKNEQITKSMQDAFYEKNANFLEAKFGQLNASIDKYLLYNEPHNKNSKIRERCLLNIHDIKKCARLKRFLQKEAQQKLNNSEARECILPSLKVEKCSSDSSSINLNWTLVNKADGKSLNSSDNQRVRQSIQEYEIFCHRAQIDNDNDEEDNEVKEERVDTQTPSTWKLVNLKILHYKSK